jgi:hypothetical protein
MYYLRQQTRVSGPFTAEHIRGLLYRGRVARSDKVSLDQTAWRPIAVVQEIIARPRPAEPVAAEPERQDTVEPIVEAEVADGRMWHYTRGGDQQPEPVDTDTLRQLVQFGQVGAADHVWTEGFEAWQTVASVPLLAMHAMPQQGYHSSDRSHAPDELESLPDLRPSVRRKRKKGWL